MSDRISLRYERKDLKSFCTGLILIGVNSCLSPFLTDLGFTVSVNKGTSLASSLIELNTSRRLRVYSLTRREFDWRSTIAIITMM